MSHKDNTLECDISYGNDLYKTIPSTLFSSGVMVAHLTPTLYFLIASAASMVTETHVLFLINNLSALIHQLDIVVIHKVVRHVAFLNCINMHKLEVRNVVLPLKSMKK